MNSCSKRKLREGIANREDLEITKCVQLERVSGGLDTVLEYRQRGMVDDESAGFHSDAIRMILANPDVRNCWKSRRPEELTTRVQVWLKENAA